MNRNAYPFHADRQPAPSPAPVAVAFAPDSRTVAQRAADRKAIKAAVVQPTAPAQPRGILVRFINWG